MAPALANFSQIFVDQYEGMSSLARQDNYRWTQRIQQEMFRT